MLVYLDTALWYDLADGSVPDTRLRESLLRRDTSLLLSFNHIIEFAALPTKDDRSHIAKYVDDLRAAGEVLWVADLVPTGRREVRAEYFAWVGSPQTPPPVVGKHLDDVLPTRMRAGGYLTDPADATQVYTELVATSRNLDRARSSLRRARARFLGDGVGRGNVGGINAYVGHFWRQRLRWFLPTTIRLPSGIWLRPREDSAFPQAVYDRDACPAVRLAAAYEIGRAFRTGTARLSDWNDLFHAPGLAYSDVGFLDAATFESLRCGRTPPALLAKLHTNGTFADWLNRLPHVPPSATSTPLTPHSSEEPT